ncbi:MAG: hypothetical protein LBT43_07545 [Prevotella sp.]|jgi:hypothetical protein|nr:hypothetical protein [Prevotella sp.]
MVNLLNPAIQCTDPDNLQFCLKISDKEFWYCEPNTYNEKLLPGSKACELNLLRKYKGYPIRLLKDAATKEDVKEFINNKQLWLSGTVDVNDFSHYEKNELLDNYGYSWYDFTSDTDRNQIICENYFEQNPMEFRNDI